MMRREHDLLAAALSEVRRLLSRKASATNSPIYCLESRFSNPNDPVTVSSHWRYPHNGSAGRHLGQIKGLACEYAVEEGWTSCG